MSFSSTETEDTSDSITESEESTESYEFSLSESVDDEEDFSIILEPFLYLYRIMTTWNCYESFPKEIIKKIMDVYNLLLPVHNNNILYITDCFRVDPFIKECTCEYILDEHHYEDMENTTPETYNGVIVHRFHVMQNGKKYCQIHSNFRFTNIANICRLYDEELRYTIKNWMDRIGNKRLWLNKGYFYCPVNRSSINGFRCSTMTSKKNGCRLCPKCNRYCCTICFYGKSKNNRFPYNLYSTCSECRFISPTKDLY